MTGSMTVMRLISRSLVAVATLLLLTTPSARQTPSLPATPLTFGFFTARFAPDGNFTLEGQGWPAFKGTWTQDAAEIQLATSGVRDCDGPGRYRVHIDGRRVCF